MHIGDADKNLKLVQLVFFNWSAHNFHLWKDIHTIEADNIVKLIILWCEADNIGKWGAIRVKGYQPQAASVVGGPAKPVMNINRGPTI